LTIPAEQVIFDTSKSNVTNGSTLPSHLSRTDALASVCHAYE
jgi:hypothetical protein